MIQSLLLDLDDTLLGNEVDVFMHRYFGLLNDYAAQRFDSDSFLPHLMQSTREMIRNTDPRLTNDQVFWASFETLTGGRRAELEPFFNTFYETEFIKLKTTTTHRPAAATLINAALERGLSVVVATNPLFPMTAIEQRLEWAGLPTAEFDFTLVTSYENMHAAKPQPAYYREILSVTGDAPENALMVGDDWKNDIVPAAEVGRCTYGSAPDDATPDDPALVTGRGTLDDLAERVAGGWLEQLTVTRYA